MFSTGTQMQSSIELFKCRVVDPQLYSVLTGENIDSLHGPCVSHSSWRQFEGFWADEIKRRSWMEDAHKQKTLKEMSACHDWWQSCDWLQMQIQQHETKKKPSLQPVNGASGWTQRKKPNRILSYQGCFAFKRYLNIRATEGPPNISRGPRRCSTRTFTGWNCFFRCSANVIMLVLLHSDKKKISQSSYQQRGGKQVKCQRVERRTHPLQTQNIAKKVN